MGEEKLFCSDMEDAIREINKHSDLFNKNKLDFNNEGWVPFKTDFVYNTNAIEGLTITQNEVYDLLNSTENKQIKREKFEIAETFGLADALESLKKTDEHLSIGLLKELHLIVFKDTKDFAGRLRRSGEEVGISDGRGNIIHNGTTALKVVSELNNLIDWYNENMNNYDPIILSALIHNNFENIHPFKDGNGRVGRLILNNILMKGGALPISISVKNRQEYYDALQDYERGGKALLPTINLLIKEHKRALDSFWKTES